MLPSGVQGELLPASASPVLLESSLASFMNLSLPEPASVSPVLLEPLSASLSNLSAPVLDSLPFPICDEEESQVFATLTPDNISTKDTNDEYSPLQEPVLDSISDPHEFIKRAITHSAERWGLETTVEALLSNNELKRMIVEDLHQKSHKQFKSSLPKSHLCSDKKKRDRNYLLSVTPRSVCEVFKTNAPDAFNLLVSGLMGVNDVETLNDNNFQMNRVALILSTVANQIDRNATRYSMVQTSAARDGGLREDSLKLFANFCYPTTMQSYDRRTLAKDWDRDLKEAMEEERQHFLALDEG